MYEVGSREVCAGPPPCLALVGRVRRTRSSRRCVARHPTSEVERFVEAKIARQARLADSTPLALWAIVGEGALRQLVGGREVSVRNWNIWRRPPASHMSPCRLSPSSPGRTLA
ncbi:Scr1 family TA system antitoxin-like transcriptional regulator [Streptomyces sp. NPDC002911]